jgi:hypothetical protein
VSQAKSVLLNIAVVGIGVMLLLFTVQRAGGWPAVVNGVTSVGWWFVLIVLIGAARMACRSFAWMACSHDTPLPFRDAMRAVLAGDTAGNLTPLGLFASEPTKVLLTKSRLSTVGSIATVTIENAFYTASVLAVLLGGTWLFMRRADVPAALEQVAEVIVLCVVMAGAIGFWVARSRPAVLSRLAPLVTRLAGRADAPAEAIRDVEARIYEVLQWPVGRLLRVVSWEALFHVLAVTEVWLVLRRLAPVTIADAFVMEAVGRFVTVAFKFVPYRVGIDEAGSGAVSQVIGLSSTAGVALALIRRIRILVLNAVGLVVWVR